jgi:hypothetical protein
MLSYFFPENFTLSDLNEEKQYFPNLVSHIGASRHRALQGELE